MFENESEFRKLVAGLKIDAEPNPAHREQLRRRMLQTFEQTEPTGGSVKAEGLGDGLTRIQRCHRQATLDAATRAHLSLFGVPIAKLAIAAAILIAAGVGVWSLVGRGPATFSQVRSATQKMPWLHAAVSRYQNGQVRIERHWYNFAAQKAYAVIDGDNVVGWEYGAESRKLVYSPRLKALQISDLSSGTDLTENLVSVFAVFAAEDKVSESTSRREGQTVRTFEVEKAGPGLALAGKEVSLVKMTVTADPQTKRIIAAGIEYQGSGGRVLAGEEWVINYPPSGPASVYDLGVPAAAAVVDHRRQRIGTPGEEPIPTPSPAPTSSFRLTPLEIRLPRPRFAGTPQDVRNPNLERPRGAPRPPFLAPAGTTNVAFGKPVSSSDAEPVIGSLDAITDGDKEAAEGSFVELSPGPQSVTIDLQERCEIYAVLVWHYHRWPREYHDVVVQVSDHRALKTGVKTIFNNDLDDSLGLGAGKDLYYVETYEGKLMDGKGAQGRYVRLFSNGNTHDDLNHYIEVEVYGRPLRLMKDH